MTCLLQVHDCIPQHLTFYHSTGDIPNQSSLTFTTGAGPSIAPALPPIKALLRKDALLAPSGAGTRLRGARAPILFDHAPYSLQSRLELRPEDVAAVVEAVVGPEPGGVPLWEVCGLVVGLWVVRFGL